MKIGIVGLGLIGGSLGLDLRAQGHNVTGISRNSQTVTKALERGIADQAGTSLEMLSDRELILICTPIAAIASTIKQLVPYLDSDTMISDVGSVKSPIVQACSPLWPNFIGGHPMAGTAESGVDAALANLFEGAAYVFTPTAASKPQHLEKLQAIARDLQAIPYVCDAQTHDRAVSQISHLPVMVSASLIQVCLQEAAPTLKLAQILASSGFRDTSRVGGGNPELGVMMAKYNQAELLRSLYNYRNNLDQIIGLIEAENWTRLGEILATNGVARPEFLN